MWKKVEDDTSTFIQIYHRNIDYPCEHDMTQITIDIPDKLISRLNSLPIPVSDIIAIALEKYLEETYNLTQTETWKLCGTLEISQSDPKYIDGKNEQGEMMTNYAEKIDEILY